MRKSLVVAILLMAPAIFAQDHTTVLSLGAGVYSVSSSAGTQLVNVVPLGSNSYSFTSSDGSSTVTVLATGTYSLTTSSGVNLGTTYIYSLGSGRYSFSNPTIGANGTIQSMPTATAIPLPALAVQSGQSDTTSLYLLAIAIKQQCEARGGIMYKAHWYSRWQCVTPDYIYSLGNKKVAAMKAKKQ